jgi:hypothetical protein
MFDAKTNSIKQLWHSLNEVYSFKNSTITCNISKLINNNNVFFKLQDICNELNQYFSAIGEKLVNNLANSDKNDCYFESYCKNCVKHSMFFVPTDKFELLKLINNLKDRKSPGADNIGPKII